MPQSSSQSAQPPTAPFEQASLYRALTLGERLALRRSTRISGQNATEEQCAHARQRLERWRSLPPFSQDGYFAERLAASDLSEEELLAVLVEDSATLQRRSEVVPEWLREFRHILTTPAYFQATPLALQTPAEQEGPSIIKMLQRTSFLEVLTPFLARGEERLHAGIQELLSRYPSAPFAAETVQHMQLGNLANLLLFQVSRTLTLELHIARLEGSLQGTTSAERFRHFLVALRTPERLQKLLGEYPSLARFLLTTQEHWLQASLEFLQRLCVDWSEIRQVLLPVGDPGHLLEIEHGAGDLHKQGRSTLTLRFASGARLIYKPRSLAVDVHFQHLLHWLNEREEHPAFRLLKLLAKETHGWSEYVEAEPCASAAEVARFYARQGSYLALFYGLEAADMHLENLIAAGEHPMIIDLEALFHPRLVTSQARNTSQTVLEILDRSVLRVGLLPQRFWSTREQNGLDLSGLAASAGQLTPQPVLQPEAVGTDQMRFTRERIVLPGANNLPRFAGAIPDVLEYRAHFIAGFTSMYRLLLACREELLADILPMFAQDETRLLVRATQTYGRLFAESTHPNLLRDGLERDCFFDRLWVQAVANPALKRVIFAEVQDLHEGNIPLFTTRPDTRDVFTSRGVLLPDMLPEPSMAAVARRLRAFDEQDLQRQIWFIQASLATLQINSGHLAQQKRSPSPGRMSGAPDSVSLSARLVQAARSAGDRLCDLALSSEYGTSWIGLTYVNQREWVLAPAIADLYNGASGIALFLAYLGQVTGSDIYTACARSALAYVRANVKELRGRMVALGGYDGWGGLFYLYSHLGALWHDQELLTEARELIADARPLVKRDEAFDMIGGSAGCIAGLLSLYSVLPTPEVLELAQSCGAHLLARAQQCQSPSSANVAFPLTNQPLTGLSHGAAGIALSLLRLAAVSGDERFRQGARTALGYERQAFSPAHQNWPDFRVDQAQGTSQPTYEMFAWCHGAPGIGLARLASLPYYTDELIQSEIEVAIDATLARGFGLNHSLCHGDLGNLETLLVAALTFEDTRYQVEVERCAAALLESIEQFGWRTGIPLEVEAPGLMTGIAGIGYELLRLAYPDQVPSVLTLEPPSVPPAESR